MSHIGNLMSHIKSDLTGPGAAGTVDSPDGAPHDTIDEWGVFASTTEALTLTILTELLRRTGEHPEVPSSVAAIVDGVYAAELDHWRFTSKHWEPSTTRFWIPDGFYGGEGDALDLTAVGKGVAAGEHLFVNTYLLGVTTFAAAGQLHVRALRGRARRERVRAPLARANARRRKPAQRPRIRGVRIRSRQPDRRGRPERRLRLRRAGERRRSLLRPPTVADRPAHPDQLERTAIGRTRRKPGPAGPRRLQPGRVYRPPGLNRSGSPARRIPRSRRLANPRPLVA